MLPRLKKVRPAGHWRLWVMFEDGVSGEVDITYLRDIWVNVSAVKK